jgi:hypothetical protein
MVFPLRLLAIGLTVFALSAAAAKADVIYTVTITGTITNGTSAGIFGANGSNLAGKTYTTTQTYDATLSSFSQNGTQYDYLTPTTTSASITVGNQTYNISSNNNGNSEYFIGSRAGGYSGDQVYASTSNSAGTAHLTDDIYSTTVSYLSSDSLSQMSHPASPIMA